MSNKSPKRTLARAAASKLGEDFRALSHKILYYANRGLPRTDFAREVSNMLIDFSGCDVVELRLKRHERYFLCRTTKDGEPHFTCDQRPCTKAGEDKMIACSDEDSPLENLCRDIILGQVDHSLPFFTKNAGFWTGDSTKLQIRHLAPNRQPDDKDSYLGGDYPSLAFFPLLVDGDNVGLLLLKSKKRDYFMDDEIELYEGLAQTLGVAMVQRAAQVALRERIKELTCLYGIAQLSAKPGISLEAIMQGIVELIPPAWFYPQIAAGRIILDGRSYTTTGFQEGKQRQTAEIVIGGEHRGRVEVTYLEERPELDEGPFLKEERSLIDAIAREAAIIIERRQAEEEKARLQDQLRHADRLATIGQLAAGVAHELNEPLGNALGFAQLAKKCPGLPQQAQDDVEKAVQASLSAREVIKKLMLFARRMPPKKTQVNLNQLVEEGLYFLESRCAKEGIEMVRSFSPNLPEITADPGQLTQVLVNLVVNAIQAMPEGGKLTVRTDAGDGYVSLKVEDTGLGMKGDVLRKIFMPFYTTKDVDKGTGLGLAVVHGIVTSHGGSINVDSKVGRGTSFEVKLPLTGAPDIQEGD